jgi:hypothetical protein
MLEVRMNFRVSVLEEEPVSQSVRHANRHGDHCDILIRAGGVTAEADTPVKVLGTGFSKRHGVDEVRL